MNYTNQLIWEICAIMGDILIILAILIMVLTGLGVLTGRISWQPRNPRP